jgi:hypothetical protein|uniref:Uncharacterized protein n=2 Tax=Pseudomonas TaxID=286 RepID=A0A2L1KDR1_PSEAI|nr:Hypothetical protein [Pseudomonas putida]AVE20469.1 Hypothetical protein [Pseudomonas aeruginosa]AVE21566.1 Hypothetical protein [Pseudomonas aeruginosa]AVE22054.1 Hypothetical protein [Pseudomonas aeruginosa]QNI16113.1 Hypothetical protein [Pseudomonas aeruginosa]
MADLVHHGCIVVIGTELLESTLRNADPEWRVKVAEAEDP